MSNKKEKASCKSIAIVEDILDESQELIHDTLFLVNKTTWEESVKKLEGQTFIKGDGSTGVICGLECFVTIVPRIKNIYRIKI